MTTYCFVCTSLLLQPTWVALDWNVGSNPTRRTIRPLQPARVAWDWNGKKPCWIEKNPDALRRRGFSFFVGAHGRIRTFRAISHRRFSGPRPSTTRPHEHMAQRAGFEPTSRGLADDGLAIRCPTVRRPLQICTLSGAMVTPSRLELLTPHWECGDLNRFVEGAIWCAGLDSNQRTVTERFYRPFDLTTCIPTHMVLPAGIEPATHRASTYCSTNWATEADGDPWGIRIPNLLREREMT